MLSSPITNTLNGEVAGCVLKAKHENAKDVFCYRGIPYAEPPTGKLRFLPPKSFKTKWSKIRQCTEYSNVPLVPLPEEMKKTCTPRSPHLHDLTLVYSEDCLYLDVYTPNLDEHANLPVMFFVYGGYFQFGCNAIKDGTSLAGLNDVVVVVPNYRVNIFGFLSLGQHSKCPGNAGLFDQQLALKWVKSNVSSFGGNPNNVTIFGVSAGSKAVGYHVDSPLSKKLFHKAIFHSGTSTSLVLNDNYRRTCLEFLLEKLNIRSDDEGILCKIQQVDSKILLDICQVMISKGLLFEPVLDGIFIESYPRDTLKKETFSTMPFILGYNDSEGMGLLSYLIPGFSEGLEENVLDDLLKALLRRFLSLNNNDLGDLIHKIKSFYIRDGDGERKYSKVYGSLVGDINYVIPTLRHLKVYSNVAPTYAYLGCFQPRLFHDKDYNPSAGIIPSFCNCDHGNDLLLTFGAPFRHNLQENVKFSDNEKVASLNFMSFLTNFARNGDPNVGNSVPCVWPRYEDTKKQTLIIRPEMTASENRQDELLDFYKFLEL